MPTLSRLNPGPSPATSPLLRAAILLRAAPLLPAAILLRAAPLLPAAPPLLPAAPLLPAVIHIPLDVIERRFDHVSRDVDHDRGCGSRLSRHCPPRTCRPNLGAFPNIPTLYTAFGTGSHVGMRERGRHGADRMPGCGHGASGRRVGGHGADRMPGGAHGERVNAVGGCDGGRGRG